MKLTKITTNITIAVVAIIGVTLFLIACKKNNTEQLNEAFMQEAAKEWYYGTFKKSSEWSASSEKGKKLPDWKHGQYRKVGNMEIVEFPLLKERTALPIPSTASLTTAEIQRVADASLTRIAFIKTKNAIEVREIDYIPDLAYAKANGYDLSSYNFGSTAQDFSGRMVIKKWNGVVMSYNTLSNGKITKRGKINKQQSQSDTKATLDENVTLSGSEICEYERYCEEERQGDAWVPIGTCTPWTPTGNCWPIDDVDPGDCNYGLTESCACQLYGLGCDNGNPPAQEQDPCVKNCEDNAAQLSSSASVASETESIEVTDITAFKKHKNTKWTCLKSFPWILSSQEEGIVELVDAANNTWNWSSLTHKDIKLTGMPVGGTVTPDAGTGTPSFVAGNSNVLYASMALDFNVTYAPVCNCPVVNVVAPPYTLNYKAKSSFWDAKP